MVKLRTPNPSIWVRSLVRLPTLLDKLFIHGIIMKLSELKKLDAVLRMTRFSTKKKGCDKKRKSKKLCRKKVSWE